MFGDGYVGTSSDSARGAMLSKEREKLFAQIKAAKERDPDKPNPCTLSGWELLFEFGVIEPTVRCRVCPSA